MGLGWDQGGRGADDGWTRARVRGRAADLVELEPLVVGRVEDALDVGLALGGEGRVGEDEVEARGDVGRPLAEHLLAHDLGAGAEPVQAQEPRPPRRARALRLRVAAEAAHRSGPGAADPGVGRARGSEGGRGGGSSQVVGTGARGPASTRLGFWLFRTVAWKWERVYMMVPSRGVAGRFPRAVGCGPRAPCRFWLCAYWVWLERPCRGACGREPRGDHDHERPGLGKVRHE